MLKFKLNRKLNKRAPDDYLWSSQTFTLKEIMCRFRLPCVVHCCYPSCPIQLSNFRWDLSQPLLLHSHHRVRKVVGTCLHKDSRTQQTIENVTKIVIPDNYEGWFYFMKSEDDRPNVYLKVDSLAQSHARRIYVASSLSCLTVNKLTKTENVEDSTVNSGEILTRCNEEGVAKTTAKLPKGKDDIKYLMFKDQNNDVVFLQSGKDGKFFEVFSHAEDDSGVVRPISDVIERKEAFPLVIRHVVGDLPAIKYGYSKVIKCCDVVEEDVLLACAVHSRMFLEIRLDTEFKFRIALNENELKESNDGYVSALKACESDGLKYLSDMKLACIVTPLETNLKKAQEPKTTINRIDTSDDSEVEDVENSECYIEQPDDVPSCYDTGSEVEEEDAQSEFSFKWSPIESQAKSKKSKSKPKVFNSSLLSLSGPMSSEETDINLWNTEPDVV